MLLYTPGRYSMSFKPYKEPIKHPPFPTKPNRIGEGHFPISTSTSNNETITSTDPAPTHTFSPRFERSHAPLWQTALLPPRSFYAPTPSYTHHHCPYDPAFLSHLESYTAFSSRDDSHPAVAVCICMSWTALHGNHSVFCFCIYGIFSRFPCHPSCHPQSPPRLQPPSSLWT